ncbi:hypothetical protein Tco_0701216 [Tanacetum coccineum]
MSHRSLYLFNFAYCANRVIALTYYLIGLSNTLVGACGMETCSATSDETAGVEELVLTWKTCLVFVIENFGLALDDF